MGGGVQGLEDRRTERKGLGPDFHRSGRRRHKGFLLSEVGFQSGALRVSENTNITLTSIADLKESAQQSVQQAAAVTLHWRMTQVKQQLWRLHRQTEDYVSEYISPLGARAEHFTASALSNKKAAGKE